MFATRQQVIHEYNENQRLKAEDDIGFTWIFHKNRCGVFNALEMAEQINLWLEKGLDIRINDYNSKEFDVEGKKWWVFIAQTYKNGEFSEEDNLSCPMSLMLFGTMVAGMTYAFETKEYRDDYARAVQAKHPFTITKIPVSGGRPFKAKNVRICNLCKGFCECEWGHNPYPILPNEQDGHELRVCGKCNSEQVLPARMKGVFRTQNITAEEKADILNDCREIVNKQYDEVEKSMWEEIGFEKTHPNLQSPCVNEPNVKQVLVRFNACMEQSSALRKRAIDETMIYASQRLERHINVRSISSPEDVCLTTRSVLSQVIYADLKEHIHKHLSLVNEFKAEVEVVRERMEQELLKTPVARPKKEKVKTKEEERKEATRNANKAQAEEKKRKEEWERQSAIAYAYKQEQMKKKAREIAIKKRKALLAQAEKVSENSK